jgi:uncharacterized membrane protein YkgB
MATVSTLNPYAKGRTGWLQTVPLYLERQLLLDVLGGSLRRNSTGEGRLVIAGSMEGIMNFIIRSLIKLGILKKDLDYHLLRALLVMICLFFGYQKWFDYEAQALIPYISHGPLIFWLYPLFGIRGATYFLGVSEWLFGALLLAGFWNKKAGILGALGLCFSMLGTSTIIPFIPGGWAASAGGFPAMTERVAFLMKDLVLLGVSVYLLRQDVIRVSLANTTTSDSTTALRPDFSLTGVMEGH